MDTYTVYELPFTARQQIVSTRLFGVEYRIKLAWNVAAHIWVMDFFAFDGTPIMRGIPIVTGADLLAQFEYLGFHGQLLALTDQTRGDLPPDFENLGGTGHVYFLPDNSQPL